MISVLYVDDEQQLLELGKLFLERSGDFRVDLAKSAKIGLEMLESSQYDIIISDYQMAGMDGIIFLKEVRLRYGSIPFILFTGRGREEVAILALNSGADFYLQKGGEPRAQFAELSNKIVKAVGEQWAIIAQKESEQRLAYIIDFLPDATFAIDKEGKVISWNRAIEEMTGVSAQQMLGKGNYEYAIPFYGDRRPILIDLIFSTPEYISHYYSQIKQTGTMLAAETTLPHPKGESRTLWGKASPLYDHNGEIVGAIESIRDISERKIIEHQFKESEEKFRETADLLPQTIYETDEKGILVYTNRMGYETFGYSKEEVEEGISVFQLMAREDWDRAKQVLGNVLAGNPISSNGAEYCAIRKDGVKFPVTIYSSPIIRNEKVVGLRGIIIDISGRKEIEEELMDRERILSTLIGNLPGVVYRCANDKDWTMMFISEKCLELTGYSTDDFITNKTITFHDIVHPDYREPLWNEWQKILKNNGVFQEEYPIITHSGETRWVWERGRGIYSDEGEVLFLEGFIIDISDWRKAQDMLLVSREQLSLAIEGSGVGLWDWDISSGDVEINEQWAEIIGYSLTELKPVSIKTWTQYCYHDDLKHSNDLLQKHFAKETPYYECEARMHHKDGRLVWVLDRGKVVEWDSENRPVRMVGTHLDITLRKQMEYAIRKTNRQLNLLTGITRHDINNQLMMLKGYLDLSKESLSDTESLLRYMAFEDSIIENIQRHIQFTHYYQDMGIQDPIWQNLNKVVKTVIISLPVGDIAICVDRDDLEVYSDLLFEKVIYNLIDNALRYGGEKMTMIRFFTEKSENGLTIICMDDGTGINDMDREHLFEHGYGKNTGFGLFLTREILGITGIEIQETSLPGKGARFEMYVPDGVYRFS